MSLCSPESFLINQQCQGSTPMAKDKLINTFGFQELIFIRLFSFKFQSPLGIGNNLNCMKYLLNLLVLSQEYSRKTRGPSLYKDVALPV